MNKYFFATLGGLLLISSMAKAENVYVPYLGLNAVYNKASNRQVKPEYYGASVRLGTSYNRYFGTEIFYTQVGSDTKKISALEKDKTSYRAYGLDMIVYAPICSSSLNLMATGGVGTYVLNEKKTGVSHASDEGYGYRFGGGMLYNITPALSLELVARYINFDHISNIDHMAEYALGFRYNFVKD